MVDFHAAFFYYKCELQVMLLQVLPQRLKKSNELFSFQVSRDNDISSYLAITVGNVLYFEDDFTTSDL